MNSFVGRALHRLFPKDEKRVLILGLDAAGKTTILYHLHLGEIVTTIPTIGSNVETVQVLTRSGVLNMVCWDVGGCDKIRPLWRHYFQGLKGVIWMIDSHDRERLSESLEEMSMMVRETTHLDDRDVVFCVMANKRDLPNTLPIEEIQAKCAPILGGLRHRVFSISALQGLVDGGLQEPMDWFAAELRAPGSGVAKDTPAPRLPNDPSILATKLEEWLGRADGDNPPEEFLQQFNDLCLPSWDHYTHVRLAFTILTIYGRQRGKDMIFTGIQKYISESKQANGRTYHETMTYFWVQIVHFGMRSMPPTEGGEAKATTDDFARFIVVNPYVVDGNLWLDYYSKDVMMSPATKEAMVLPDKKPLPNLVSRETVKNWRA